MTAPARRRHTPWFPMPRTIPILLLILLLAPVPSRAQIDVAEQKKISAFSGGFISRIDAGDYFGEAVVRLGDLDGDGTSDLAVGAPLDDDGGTDRGAVWILFLNPDGTVKAHQKISATEGGFSGILDDQDQFGRAVAAPGDLDGDGTNDLAVGAPLDDDGNTNQGSLWVLFLNPDGTVKDHQKISATEGGFTGQLNVRDEFSTALTRLGDLDGDGTTELAAGARWDDDGGMDRGAVWVLFLNPDGTVKTHQKISNTEGGFSGILRNLDQFGAAVGAPGDLNGDGIPDLAVGAPRAKTIWLLWLNRDGTVQADLAIPDLAPEPIVFQGAALTRLGDLDGDGTPDLAVGAPRDDDGGAGRGTVWILFLRPDGTVKAHRKISNTEGGLTGDLTGNPDLVASLGLSAAGVGDLDGDGTPDLAVGDPNSDVRRGAVWILFLNPDGTVRKDLASAPPRAVSPATSTFSTTWAGRWHPWATSTGTAGATWSWVPRATTMVTQIRVRRGWCFCHPCRKSMYPIPSRRRPWARTRRSRPASPSGGAPPPPPSPFAGPTRSPSSPVP